MSATNEIGCRDCKVMLWVGQRDYVYTAEDDTMKALGAFLEAHKGHHLEYNTEHRFDLDSGWRRVDLQVDE